MEIKNTTNKANVSITFCCRSTGETWSYTRGASILKNREKADAIADKLRWNYACDLASKSLRKSGVMPDGIPYQGSAYEEQVYGLAKDFYNDIVVSEYWD